MRSKYATSVPCRPPLNVFFTFQDDVVVPFILGERLFEAAKKTRVESSKPIEFIRFEGERRLGHVSIHTAQEFPDIIKLVLPLVVALGS